MPWGNINSDGSNKSVTIFMLLDSSSVIPLQSPTNTVFVGYIS